MEYMENQWFTSHDTWYEGYYMFAPSTNNACEATNRTIKDEHTLRERLPMSTFKERIMEMIKICSEAYKGEKQFIQTPTISLNTWTDAYNWNKTAKGIISVEAEDTITYYANSSSAPINNDIHSSLSQRWTTFDQFKRRAFNVWSIQYPKDSTKWKEGTYTCPHFLKKLFVSILMALLYALNM